MKAMQILVVDDSLVIRLLVSEIITNMGHIAVLAENGRQALEYVQGHDVDLILMDVEMPKMNGFEATMAIRVFQGENWIPIIFLTGNADDNSYVECINAGGDAFLAKPINPVRLKLQIAAMERIYLMRKKLQAAQMELLQLNESLKYLSFFDQLTGLANRRNFDETLAREFKLASRQKQPLSLFMCDVDYFKLFNDSNGHIEGDHCLVEVAKAIGVIMSRPGDLACRYGGEEFTLILPCTNLQGARCLAEKLCHAVHDLRISHRASKVSEFVSLSIGVSIYNGQFKSVDELIKAADDALYQAKQKGRNRFEIS